jgi:hypothetical protein
MIAIICVLAAFPLGFFMRSRFAALTTYSIAYLWAFVFQTLYLLLDSLGGGSAPAFEAGEFPLSYGLVALAIFLAGLGLATLGHWVRSRRRGRIPTSAGTSVA